MKRILLAALTLVSSMTMWAVKTPQAIWTEGNTTLTFINFETVYAEGSTYNGQAVTRVWSGSGVTQTLSIPQWQSIISGKTTTVVFDQSFKDVRPTSTARWFSGFSSLATIQGIEYLNTSEVTNMSFMFATCKSLTELDVTHFDTSKVTDMLSMFSNCNNITKLDVTHFNTSKVTNMGSMFTGCYLLESIDLSSFNTENVTSMVNMFNACQTLKTLDLSSFRTPKLTTMQHMFNNCNALESIDLSNFDTSNVINMNNTFYGCERLESIDFSNFRTPQLTNMMRTFCGCRMLKELDLSMFDTSKVTTMYETFRDCQQLTKLDISSFDTQRVTTMNGMFQNCASLPELDVSHFNTSKVTEMSWMFAYCSKLETLDVRSFDTGQVKSIFYMFVNCHGLYYLDLTHFDMSYVTSSIQWLNDMPETFVYAPAGYNPSTSRTNLILGDRESGFTCQNCVFYDNGRDLRIPYPFKAEKVTYQRTIARGGNGNTIMLPCDFKVPSGMKAYQLRPAERQVRDDIIYFQELAEGEMMKANTPYLIANWGTQDVTRMTLSGPAEVMNTINYYDLAGTTQLTSYAGSETIETTLKDGTEVTMRGTFRYMPNAEVADQGIYIFQTGNKWKQVMSSNTSAHIPAYRAYLQKRSGSPSGVSLFNSTLMDYEAPTGVTDVPTTERHEKANLYDLSGRPVTESRRGIVVTDGKKRIQNR
ncbi:MAG: BspA family leucine-rich repeat surface protein [Bacteroidaceae bacterium]|nr:BspA family leucine-rich repeat surface protein [Bacteroidaceae bacterium]